MLPIVRGCVFRLEPELRECINCNADESVPYLGEWLVKWTQWRVGQEMIRRGYVNPYVLELIDEDNRP